MNALPYEILVQILAYLDLPQLIWLRRLNKQFRFVIDEFMIIEMIVLVNMQSDSDLSCLPFLWSQSPNEKNVIKLRSTKHLFDQRFNFVFRNLRRLFVAINSHEGGAFQMDLPKLRHCEIRLFRGDAGQFIDLSQSDLSVPKPADYPSFVIRSEQLESFHINYLSDNIKLQSTELHSFSFDLCQRFKPFPPLCKSIRTLRCVHFDKWTKKLHFLEQLYIGQCWLRSGRMLRYFPLLKLLYVHTGHESFLRSIDQERTELKSACKIIYGGSAELNAGLLAHARSGLRSLTSAYLTACHSIGSEKVSPVFPFAVQFKLDYHFLAIWRDDRTFHLRFADSLQILRIEPYQLPQQMVIKIIEQFGRLICLQIGANMYSSQFYNRLPKALKCLRSLEIDNSHLMAPEFNLKFLIQFQNLHRVELCRSTQFSLSDLLILQVINARQKNGFLYRLEDHFYTSLKECF